MMPNIVLDFDNCLFDTEQLKEIMADCGVAENERGQQVFDRIRSHSDYVDFDARSLVFADALEFIQEYGGQCKILTTSTSINDANNTQDLAEAAAYQELKLQLSGVLEHVTEFEVLPGEKLEALERDKENGYEVFVDDRENHVRSGVAAGMKTFWLRRGKITSQSPEQIQESIEGVTEIASFADLRRELEKLES